jgi:hypothetical protein
MSSLELPQGLSRPSGVASQLMAFFPKLPTAMLQLRAITIRQCSLSLALSESSGGGGSYSRWLAFAATYWPLLTAVYLSAALIETLCRQWIWYRLLEQHVVM